MSKDSVTHNASQLPEFKDHPLDISLMGKGALRKAIIPAWKRRFGVKCPCCDCEMLFDNRHQDSDSYATIDHIVARALGGKHELSNIQVVCKWCNNKKSKDEFRDSFKK